MRVCEVEGCNEKHYAKGYCRKHYNQMRRTKKEEVVETKQEVIETKQEVKKNKKGIIWDKENEVWRVYIKKNKKLILIGEYEVEEDAIKAKELAEKTFA